MYVVKDIFFGYNDASAMFEAAEKQGIKNEVSGLLKDYLGDLMKDEPRSTNEFMEMTDDEWEDYLERQKQNKEYEIKAREIKHSDPSLYGLSEEWAKSRKAHYTRKLIKELKSEIFLQKRENLNGNKNYERLSDLIKRCDKLELTLRYLEGKVNTKTYDIEAVKKVPMDKFTEILPNRFFKDNPFRTEDSPSNSLYWYKNDNHWHDFGTGKSGDVIDLVIAINKCNFQQACEIIGE